MAGDKQKMYWFSSDDVFYIPEGGQMFRGGKQVPLEAGIYAGKYGGRSADEILSDVALTIANRHMRDAIRTKVLAVLEDIQERGEDKGRASAKQGLMPHEYDALIGTRRSSATRARTAPRLAACRSETR